MDATRDIKLYISSLSSIWYFFHLLCAHSWQHLVDWLGWRKTKLRLLWLDILEHPHSLYVTLGHSQSQTIWECNSFLWGQQPNTMSWFLQKFHSLMPIMNTFGAVYNRSWGAGSTLPIFQDIPNQRGNGCAVVANQVAVALYQQSLYPIFICDENCPGCRCLGRAYNKHCYIPVINDLNAHQP